jgi:hypothetical protein
MITKGTVIERPEAGSHMGAGLLDRFTAIGKGPTAVVGRPGISAIVIVRTTYAEDNTH